MRRARADPDFGHGAPALPGAGEAAPTPAKDELVIGITQFPSTLQPQHRFDGGQELRARHDAAAVHRLRRRLEAGLPPVHRAADASRTASPCASRCPKASRARRARRGRGHLHDPARRDLGRRHAGDHRGRAVHLRGRQATRQRHQQRRALPAHPRHRRRWTTRPSSCTSTGSTFRLQRAWRLPRPAGASRAARCSRPIPRPTATAPPSTPIRPTPGCAFGPYRITEVASGSHIVLEPQPDLVGRRSRTSGGSWCKRDREHRGARGQPAVRRDRHDRRRARPDARPGAGVRAAPRRPVPRPLSSRGWSTSTSTSTSTTRSWPICGCARP